MSAVGSLVQSTIGKKVAMGATGLVLVGWIFLHMAGNTLVFMGQESFNHYAAFIQSGFGVEPALLWLMRAFMLGCIGVHIWAARALTLANRAARPVAYQAPTVTRETTYAARFMLLGGLVVLAFLAFHLAHLTLGVVPESISNTVFNHKDAYANLVRGMKNPGVALFYVIANLALAAHLRHGVTSGLQTLGLNHPKYDGLKKNLGVWVPGLLLAGNLSVVFASLLGLVADPNPNWLPASH